MSAAVASPPRLSAARVLTPGDWVELDLHTTTCHRSIRRAVREAVGRNPGLAPDRVRLIALLDGVVKRAQESGAFFCSSLVMEEAETGGVLVANVLLQLAPAAGAAPADMTADDMCAALAASVTCDPDWADADVSVVLLPSVGPAVRMEVVSGGICLQFLVPLATSAEQLVLTFTSPCPPFVAPLLELFDTMATSLSLEYLNADAVAVFDSPLPTRQDH